MLFLKDDLSNILTITSKTMNVFAPAIIDGTSCFADFKQNKNGVNFDLQNTKISPKEILFPSTETLYTWGKSSKGSFIESALTQVEPYVLFGVRPCDCAAIERLDKVFLTKGYIDEFYQSKRDAMTLVAIACSKTSDSCFCDSMGQSPLAAPNADILLIPDEANYEVFVQSDKGQKLIDTWSDYLHEGEIQKTELSCKIQVSSTGIAEKLHDMFDHPLWDEISNACLSCGSCTFICPTCHCFDISQTQKVDNNYRFRCWDSCMFKDYTLMAGNHNPRDQKRNRVRQRFMHKLCFFEERYGESLCVGCGRCLIDCPASIDITSIIDKINELKPCSDTGALTSIPKANTSQESQTQREE